MYFFEEDDLQLVKNRKHMHWLQLKPVILENPYINLLDSISAKYHGIEYLELYRIFK